MDIDQAFIAAILTVIGYSVNDTVIVYDRIREDLSWKQNVDQKEEINGALNSTLSRTINTSATTFVVLLVIFLMGGVAIKGFVFALLIGVIVGTYSSICIAAPVMVDMTKKINVKI
jgi:SecD/SecF fusion protein